MLKKKSLPWPIKQFKSMQGKGKLNFDIAIQRKGDIWDIHRKSLLIHSLLIGFPVPHMYAKFEDEVYSFIDGKQRMTCVLSYLEDGFILSGKTPDVDGKEVAGSKFSELSDEFQKILTQTTFTVVRFEDISDEEIEQMFFRLNNGVALKPIESTRVLLGTDNMKVVETLSSHQFFISKTSISRNRYTDQESVLHLIMLTKNIEIGLSSKEVRGFVEGYRRVPFESQLLEDVQERLSYLDSAFDKKRKYLKKIHLPMVYHLVKRAKEKELTPECFGVWVDEFYKELDKESAYSQACQSGSAKKENVKIRISEIEKAFEDFFAVYEKEQSLAEQLST